MSGRLVSDIIQLSRLSEKPGSKYPRKLYCGQSPRAARLLN